MKENLLTYYELLGIPPDASDEQILKAYREKAKDYHPDKNGGHKSANQLFLYIKQAKEILIDPKTRLEYDYLIGVKKKQNPRPPQNKGKNNSSGIGTEEVVAGAAFGLLIGLLIGGSRS